jgi:hypothetical protein
VEFEGSQCEEKSRLSSANFSRDLWLISTTFYEQLLRQHYFEKELQSRSVFREKLCRALSYGNGARKMLMKLTPKKIAIAWEIVKVCENAPFGRVAVQHGTPVASFNWKLGPIRDSTQLGKKQDRFANEQM